MPSLDGAQCIIGSPVHSLTIGLSRHILHRDTLGAASAIYKGRLKPPSRAALIIRSSRAPRKRGWHCASYFPGHLHGQLYLLLTSSHSHSLCKCRLDGSLHRSSRSHWRGVRGKRVLKMSSNEEGKGPMAPVLRQPYQRCSLRWVLVRHYLETCALVSPHIMTTPSLWFPPI